MKIVITDKVREYMETKGLKIITLNIIQTRACCGTSISPSVEHIKPTSLADYNHYNLNDIDVYIDKVTPADELIFVLKSFLALKYIDVQGIKLL